MRPENLHALRVSEPGGAPTQAFCSRRRVLNVKEKSFRIAFTTFPVPGQLNPTTTLPRRLKARGDDVVFIGVAEPALHAAQVPFVPYAAKEFPAGSTRSIYERLSTLEGQTGLEYTVIVVNRAPQLELLKRATLCITHAGLHTTLEALARGVALAAIPVTNDPARRGSQDRL